MTLHNQFETRSQLRVPRRTSRWSVAATSFLLLVGGMTSALGQTPPTEAVEQGATPMDQIDLTNPQPG